MLALRFSVGRARGSDLGSWIQRGIDLGLKCPLDYEREVSRHSRRPPRCARAYGGESAHRLSDPQEAKTAAGGHSRCRKRLLRADGGLSVAARTSPRRPTRRCERRLTRPRSLRDRGSVVPPEPDDALTPSQSVARLLAGIDALAGSEWSPADQIRYVRRWRRPSTRWRAPRTLRSTFWPTARCWPATTCRTRACTSRMNGSPSWRSHPVTPLSAGSSWSSGSSWRSSSRSLRRPATRCPP